MQHLTFRSKTFRGEGAPGWGKIKELDNKRQRQRKVRRDRARRDLLAHTKSKCEDQQSMGSMGSMEHLTSAPLEPRNGFPTGREEEGVPVDDEGPTEDKSETTVSCHPEARETPGPRQPVGLPDAACYSPLLTFGTTSGHLEAEDDQNSPLPEQQDDDSDYATCLGDLMDVDPSNIDTQYQIDPFHEIQADNVDEHR